MKWDDFCEEEIAIRQEQHRRYMREWRKKNKHKLTPDQRRKDICRSYAGVYKRRGLLEPEACKVCGSPAQMHHPDYSKPLEVVWLCVKHHRELHQAQRGKRHG